MRIVSVLAALLVACGGETAAPAAAPSAAAPSAAAPSAPAAPEAVPYRPSPAPTGMAPPTPSPIVPIDPPGLVPSEPPAPSIAAAIAPAGAATVLDEIVRAHTHYVLYALDAAGLARADVLASPDGPERLERIDEEIEDCADDAEGGWPPMTCLAAAVPDIDLGARVLCPSVRSIGVARVVEREAFTLEAQRLLFAFTCSSAAGPANEIRANDLDGDGADEVTVFFAIAPPDSDDLSSEEGRIGYVLDGRDLHTQHRASREWDAVIGDVGGSSTSGESTWRILAPGADGHRALHARAHGRDATQDDETGDSTSDPFDTSADCPYDAARDAWACPPGVVRDYFFASSASARLGEAWVGETPEQVLGALSTTLGSALRGPSRAEQEEAEAQGEEEIEE